MHISVPTPARDIRVLARIPGELHVTWKEPSKMNGNVTHYYVYWQPQVLDLDKFDQRDYCQDSKWWCQLKLTLVDMSEWIRFILNLMVSDIPMMGMYSTGGSHFSNVWCLNGRVPSVHIKSETFECTLIIESDQQDGVWAWTALFQFPIAVLTCLLHYVIQSCVCGTGSRRWWWRLIHYLLHPTVNNAVNVQSQRRNNVLKRRKDSSRSSLRISSITLSISRGM